MCVQYLQKPDPSRGKKSQQKEPLGVEKCSVCTAKRSQIKGRNSCVYFAEVRTDPKRRPPAWFPVDWRRGGGRHPEHYHLLHRTKCNLHPIIHKRKLRQRYPVDPVGDATSDSVFVRGSFFRFRGLRIFTPSRQYGRRAKEQQQEQKNRRSPFITFPGTFTVFIINRKYAEFSSGWNRHSSGPPEDKPPLNLSVIFTPPSEMVCIFNNPVKKGLKLLFLPSSLLAFKRTEV